MTLHVGTGAQGSTFTLALAGIALRAVRQLMQALKNRMQVRELAHLDDRALKDIGLVRSDVDAALDTPLHRDPSQHLVDVAGHPRTGAKPEIVVTARDVARLRGADADVKASGVLPRAA